ncbi:MAG: lytic transglycosylase domain-containing protein [Saprospiraceae bacterium]|nr:lytic transglycosylase domain-containing protein [Saprospiraceae bacterium]MBK9629793.1 lytic transglycosylase domain-containing protein [Saprospiraceae bacterium]
MNHKSIWILTLISLTLMFLAYSIPFDSIFDPLPQKIHPVKINSKVQFAGEEIPTDYFDVLERLERELLLNSYHHSSMILHIKMSSRYFPTIEKIFAQEGVPEDFKYLAIAESSFRYATSPAGARGIWQFREASASEYQLEVNEFVDERNHFEKSTYAAASYLKKLKLKFGSWVLAAAAYNMGPTALQRSIDEQKESSFFDMNLGEETNRYLFRIIAFREIMEQPEKFGYYLSHDDYYKPFNSVEKISVDTSISNLADFAHNYNITYRQLKLYNPWLMKTSLPNKNKKSYEIVIPK